MAVKQAWLQGLRPVAGSFRLIGLRWLLWILSALPGLVAASVALERSIAHRPYFIEAGDPLPFVPLAHLLRSLPGPLWGVLAAGAALAWFGNLLFTAGAVEVLDPNREGGVRVWRSIVDTGTRYLWVYLRVALLALVLLLIGGRVLSLIFEAIDDHGRLVGWPAKTMVLTLPVIRTLLFLCWASIVGALALWCRVLSVTGGRRYVRRLPALALRVWWRRPLQGLIFHVVLALTSLFIGTLVLLAWRQSSSATAGWVSLWLVVLFLQSFLWHWRLRVCRLVWTDARFDNARIVPDSPWHVLRRLAKRLRRRRSSPTLSGEIQDA
jgi:hypothetical protein